MFREKPESETKYTAIERVAVIAMFIYFPTAFALAVALCLGGFLTHP